MMIYHGLENLNIDYPTAVTVGSFDGIHLGHQQILKVLKKKALKCRCSEVLLTFHPHPRLVVGPPDRAKPQFLTTLDEKLELLQNYEIPAILIIPFTKEFSQTSYRHFIKEFLVDRLKVQEMVIGHDHTFGRNREGHPEQLKKNGKEFGFNVTVVDALFVDDQPVSSTRIRKALQQGRMAEAAKLLGRPYFFHGTVVEGDHRGQKLGFPTANLELSDSHKLLPAAGVYAVEVLLKNQRYSGMMNIGHRPTFNFDPLTLEVHIFKFTGSIYGETLKVEIGKFIREEKKFSSKEELIKQLENDKQICQNLKYPEVD
ncbi:MAG: bifunctional riboflavin kinase/FAD synthetase [Calditrichia bacterium]